MALPKKRKFLRFSLPKTVKLAVVHKRRNRGFRYNHYLIKNQFYACIETVVITNIYFYLLPALEMIRAYSFNFTLHHSFVTPSIFFFKDHSYLTFKNRYFVFNKLSAHIIYSFYPICLDLTTQVKLRSLKSDSFSLSETSA